MTKARLKEIPTRGVEEGLTERLVGLGADPLRMATLGPQGTSSERAAYELLEVCETDAACIGEVSLYPSFEEAARSVMEGESAAVVVANAYSEVNALYMSPRFFLAGAFMSVTPDYGLVVSGKAPIPLCVSVATHPAPAALVGELAPPSLLVQQTLQASSTSEAAKMVADGKVDLALTNETSAREYSLRFISPKRPIRMLWSVFVASSKVDTSA
ncbi:MAG: hypothetical protein H0V53_07680 [Rubrobacter sp.]|nr:hypothetical protein [Rubrobacter sp.]